MTKYYRLVAFVLIACTCLAACLGILSGCKADPGEGEDSYDPETSERDVVLFSDGVFHYQVVYNSDNSNARTIALEFCNAAESVTGVRPEIKIDDDDADSNDSIKEILIGETNRKQSEGFLSNLAIDEYGSRVDGSKLVFVANTDKELEAAVEEFLEEVLGYVSADDYATKDNISVAGNYSIVRKLNQSKNVAVYVTNDSPTYVQELIATIKNDYKSVTQYGINDAVFVVFDADVHDLVLVAGADVMPVDAGQAMIDYMNEGGRVLILGGPAFETLVAKRNGKWLDKTEYYSAAAYASGRKFLLLDTADEDELSFVTKHNDSNGTKPVVEIKDGGLDKTEGELHVSVEKYNQWNTVKYSWDADAFKKYNGKYNYIGIWAKDTNGLTNKLCITLSDGTQSVSAVIEITEEWEYYLIPETAFKKESGSKFYDVDVSFENMTTISIGFEKPVYNAAGTSLDASYEHSFAIAEPMFVNIAETLPDFAESNIEHLAPMHELYPITNGANIITEDQTFVSERNYILPDDMYACFVNQDGIGYNDGSAERVIPLLRVTDSGGLHSGYPAWITINCSTASSNGAKEGSMLGCFGIDSNEFYNADGLAAVREALHAMASNTFLVDAGATENIYITGETPAITTGANYVMIGGGSSDNLLTTISVYKGDTLLDSFTSENQTITKKINNISSVGNIYKVTDTQTDKIVVELSSKGRVIDRITQSIRWWTAKPVSERSFVSKADGSFIKDGEPITFFGTNYWPQYYSTSTNQDAWAAREEYSARQVYYDLQRIKDMGMNAITIAVYYDQVYNCNNLLDVVTMAESMGIYVNIAPREYAYPLTTINGKKFDAEKVETMIKRLHFDINDNVIGYDIAWEERIGSYNGSWGAYGDPKAGDFIGRQAWDDDWTQWVIDQYGSVDAAEVAWGCEAEIPEGAPNLITVSDARMNDTSGTYTQLLAAYYRFMDDQIAKEMVEEMAILRSLAPNQLMSFRMSYSGSGHVAEGTTTNVPSIGLFDFQSLASSLDYMEPEGYLVYNNEESLLQIPIANAYARYVAPDSPVVWKEFGLSVWNTSRTDCNFVPAEALQNKVADHYRNALEYMLNSYTSGFYSWWYTSGYRYGEESDCGIINPDGSDREVTKVLREYAPKFINQGGRPEAEAVITIERDDQEGGIVGIYEAVKDEAREAYDAGLYFEFADKKQNGTAFGEVYAHEVCGEAVGGTDTSTGTYPLRYVNGIVESVTQVNKADGQYIRVTVCNTKQSTWAEGTVSLVSTDDSVIQITSASVSRDVKYLDTYTFEVKISGTAQAGNTLKLRFEVAGIEFGNTYRYTFQ